LLTKRGQRSRCGEESQERKPSGGRIKIYNLNRVQMVRS
jgi:hypothetical protein